MNTRREMFEAGVRLAGEFCALNGIPMPAVRELQPSERLYHLATCAYYRPTTIHIMVDKCANKGYGGRAWSWPGYCIDRTPFGVIQHELGHHVDGVWFYGKGEPNWNAADRKVFVFSVHIYNQSREKPLTGYLGTDTQALTFYMEWFAENFRLFVTNPDLSAALRPKFHRAMLNYGLKTVVKSSWEIRLLELGANERILNMARRKVQEALADSLELLTTDGHE